MAKQQVKFQLDAWEKRVLKDMNKITRKRNLLQMGNETLHVVRERTRKGYGVKNDGGVRKLLKPLSKKYVEYRKEYARYLHGTTNPRKSNVTLTGQMLESLRVKPKKLGFIIRPSGIRSGETLTNLKLAEYLAKQGRVYMNLSAIERRKLKAYFRRRFVKFKKT